MLWNHVHEWGFQHVHFLTTRTMINEISNMLSLIFPSPLSPSIIFPLTVEISQICEIIFSSTPLCLMNDLNQQKSISQIPISYVRTLHFECRYVYDPHPHPHPFSQLYHFRLISHHNTEVSLFFSHLYMLQAVVMSSIVLNRRVRFALKVAKGLSGPSSSANSNT